MICIEYACLFVLFLTTQMKKHCSVLEGAVSFIIDTEIEIESGILIIGTGNWLAVIVCSYSGRTG